MTILTLATLFVILYLLPAFVAGARGHQNTGAILALNLLLGWTMIGWIVALVWSLTVVPQSSVSELSGPYAERSPYRQHTEDVAAAGHADWDLC